MKKVTDQIIKIPKSRGPRISKETLTAFVQSSGDGSKGKWSKLFKMSSAEKVQDNASGIDLSPKPITTTSVKL